MIYPRIYKVAGSCQSTHLIVISKNKLFSLQLNFLDSGYCFSKIYVISHLPFSCLNFTVKHPSVFKDTLCTMPPLLLILFWKYSFNSSIVISSSAETTIYFTGSIVPISKYLPSNGHRLHFFWISVTSANRVIYISLEWLSLRNFWPIYPAWPALFLSIEINYTILYTATILSPLIYES